LCAVPRGSLLDNIMAALCNRTGHYNFVLWYLLSFFIFFPAYCQPSEIGCLPYFHTLCNLSAYLENRFEGEAVFAGLTTVTDRPTDHATRSVTIGRIYTYAVLRCGLKQLNWSRCRFGCGLGLAQGIMS